MVLRVYIGLSLVFIGFNVAINDFYMVGTINVFNGNLMLTSLKHQGRKKTCFFNQKLLVLQNNTCYIGFG